MQFVWLLEETVCAILLDLEEYNRLGSEIAQKKKKCERHF